MGTQLISHIWIALALLMGLLFGAILYARRRYRISLALLGGGALAFFVSSQVLEKLVHLVVLQPQKDGTIALMQEHPYLYVVYGIVLAAVFEETARLFVFKWMKKKRELEMRDAISYGLGHGGLELFFLGVASLLSILFLVLAVQSRGGDASSLLPPSVQTTLSSLTAGHVYVLVLERLIAMVCQLLLTFWVWYAVTKKDIRYLVVAYAVHALFDLAPALSQVGILPHPVLVEGLLFVEVLGFLFLTKRYIWKK